LLPTARVLSACRTPHVRSSVWAALFAGVTGPLLSTFLPPLVQRVLGDHPTVIGFVMALDNVLLLLLVPVAGAVSDQLSARGRGRLPIVLPALVLAAAGMALLPESVQRSPFQSLVADLVPSRHRSLSGSVTFQMCVGAIVFLMLGQLLGMQAAYGIAALTVLVIAAAVAFGLREPRASHTSVVESTVPSSVGAARSACVATSRDSERSSSPRCCCNSRFKRSPRGMHSMAPNGSASGPKTSRPDSSRGPSAASSARCPRESSAPGSAGVRPCSSGSR
jgi:hypothetical protein